jgi:putative endonuclease
MSERLKHYRKGLLAEWLAMAFLMCKGYRPCWWRARTPVGEIDLVMRRGTAVVFVEVKARRSTQAGMEAVTPRNQQRVARAAQYLMASHPALASCTCRFDVVVIPWYVWPHHIQHAFY